MNTLTILKIIGFGPVLAGYIYLSEPAEAKESAPVVWSETDPIGTFIGQKMGWDAPAPKQTPSKPKAAPTISAVAYDDSWATWTPEQHARAAEATAAKFRRASRLRFDQAFAVR